MNTITILHNIGQQSLNRIKNNPLFPYKTGFLKQHTQIIIQDDALVFNFDSPYSSALANSRAHHNFGTELINQDTPLLLQDLKQAYLTNLKETIDGSLSNC